jgi:hypothetical protein
MVRPRDLGRSRAWAVGRVDLQIAQFDPVITVHGTGDHERNCALDQGRVRVAARDRRTG